MGRLTHQFGRCLAGVLILQGFLSLACAPSPENRNDQLSVPVHEPDLEVRIGSLDDPVYALTTITQVEVDRSGRMYTLHRSEQLIRIFGADGTLERAVGGPGDGPGEFRAPSDMGWVADTLWVMDNFSRVSLFSPDGDFHTSFNVPYGTVEGMVVQPPRAQGLLSDGAVWGGPLAFSHLIAQGVFTHHEIVLMGRDGAIIDSVARFPIGRNDWSIHEPGDPLGGGSYRRQPFADGPMWAFVPDERAMIHVDRRVQGRPDGSSFSISKVSFEGDTLFSRVYFTPSLPIRDAEVDSVLAEVVSSLVDSPMFEGLTPARARIWAEHDVYRPAVRPAVTELVVGKTGEVWLKESASASDPTWLRLAPDGEPRQRVALPDGLTLLVADGENVWGTETDDLDVPYLVRYRVPPNRSQPGS